MSSTKMNPKIAVAVVFGAIAVGMVFGASRTPMWRWFFPQTSFSCTEKGAEVARTVAAPWVQQRVPAVTSTSWTGKECDGYLDPIGDDPPLTAPLYFEYPKVSSDLAKELDSLSECSRDEPEIWKCRGGELLGMHAVEVSAIDRSVVVLR